MFYFKVMIYDYNTYAGFNYYISGYAYSGDNKYYTWNAFSIGSYKDKSQLNLPVIFTDDGLRNVITIGNDDTLWNYVKVRITDVTIGQYNDNYDDWRKNWKVEIISDNSDLSAYSAAITDPWIGNKVVNAESLSFTHGNEINFVNGSFGNNRHVTFNYRNEDGTLPEAGINLYRFGNGLDGSSNEVTLEASYFKGLAYRARADASDRSFPETYLERNNAKVTIGKSIYCTLNGSIDNAVGTFFYRGTTDETYVGGIGIYDHNINDAASKGTTLFMGLGSAPYGPEYGLWVNDKNIAYKNYTVHHDGNSFKISKGSTAPTDINNIWIDTVNKIIKVYIDGAWVNL